jgi:hypothetical protein
MDIYLFGILVVMLVFTGATGGLGILIYIGVPKRRPTDASQLNLPFPTNAQATIDQLIVLGFHRLGETYTRMPLAMSPGPSWIFIDDQMTTQAEIVDITPGTFFITVFSDGSVVETGFPQGENIRTPNFLSQTVTTSVAVAYQQHVQSAIEFQASHGKPQELHSMKDYLHWDSIYRTRHAQRKMRRLFLVDIAQFLALAYGIIVSIVVWLLWQRHAPVPQWVTDWDRGLFLLLAPAFIVSVLSTLIGFIGSRQNRKRAKTR